MQPIATHAARSVAVCLCAGNTGDCQPCTTDEPIEIPFGGRLLSARRNHVLDKGRIDANWRIQLNGPCPAAMRLNLKLL